MDAFLVLGLPRRASLTEEEVRAAYFRCAKEAEADQGELNAALQMLVTAERRLKHLIEIAAPEEMKHWRTVSMPESLMELFMRVGRVKSVSEELLKKRQNAQSALAKALLEPAILKLRDEAETVAGDLSAALDGLVDGLPAVDETLESGGVDAWKRLAEIQAHVAYLAKWQAQVRELLLGLM